VIQVRTGLKGEITRQQTYYRKGAEATPDRSEERDKMDPSRKEKHLKGRQGKPQLLAHGI